ncbi:MAG TPA: hypothetical protein VFD39_02270 [Trueperaceae bacterium]|nr:hypothetical protein [Trueperaceae bacterium]
MSGSEALASITRAVKDEQERTRKLDGQLSAANQDLLKLDRQRNQLLQELAKVRIDYLNAADVVARLDAADRQVLALMRDRAEATGALQGELDEIESHRADLEQRRADLQDRLEGAAKAIDDAEVEAQRRLAEDEAYQEQLRRTTAAERVAVHADEKATQSEQEQGTKGKSYRSDPLFMYLWRRHYGTPDYVGGGITRWLDGKVARLIGYADARANYARLIELPVRLRDHADQVGAKADEELAKLKQLDEQSRVAAGVSELEETHDRVAEQIAEVDQQIASTAEAAQAKLANLETYAKGEDDGHKKAVSFLSSEFGRDDIKALRQDATATPSPDDDVIVAHLLDLEAARERLGETVSELKEVAATNRERLSELEKIRQEFAKRHYDAPGSTFANENVFGTVLSQLLMGALSAESFWRVLQQQRSYNPPRSDPTFGSGGFGRGTVWGGSTRSRGGGGIGGMIGGMILGEILGGLGDALDDDRGGGWGGLGGGRPGGWGGGSFGGTGRARSSRPSSRSGGMRRGGGFKTGGRF